MENEKTQKVLQSQEKEIMRQNLAKEPFLTVDEASKYLGISKSSLYKKMSNREISYYKPGGKKGYFLVKDLNNWVFQARLERADVNEMIDDILAGRRDSQGNIV